MGPSVPEGLGYQGQGVSWVKGYQECHGYKGSRVNRYQRVMGIRGRRVLGG